MLLRESFLPSPMTLEADVTDSKIPPFSDKLMMVQITSLVASGIGQYGASLSQSPRADLASTYTRLSAKLGNYGGGCSRNSYRSRMDGKAATCSK
ncbi:DUF3231 family protein [Paenibacillus aceris]|nr:DUF3231 family protein [Paenibacillus aceris]